MELNSFCVVSLGEKVLEVLADIRSVCEGNIKKVAQQGVLIATFKSAFTAREIEDFLDKEKRTFFIFEVGVENSAFKIAREDIQDDLFAWLLADKAEINLSGDTYQAIFGKTVVNIPLDEQLRIAVENEDYVKAAEIRDQINKQ